MSSDSDGSTSLRRALSVAAAALLLVGVVAVVVASRLGSSSHPQSKSVTVVHGVIGSEKLPFFNDPAVRAELERQGYTVQVDAAGSREIATTTDLSHYDFAFPAGEPQADKIKRDHKVARVYQPFYTPMAIAT